VCSFFSSSRFVFLSHGKVLSWLLFFFSCSWILKLILTSSCFYSFWSNKFTILALSGILFSSFRMDYTDFFCSSDSFLNRKSLSSFFYFIFYKVSSVMSFNLKLNSSQMPYNLAISYVSKLFPHGSEVIFYKPTIMFDSLKRRASNSHSFHPARDILVDLIAKLNELNILWQWVFVLLLLPPHLNQVQT